MNRKKKLVRRARQGKPINQVAALPYRISATGELEVLILTSRGTGRFIVPKGWPMKGLKNRDAAAREAVEEAGVTGVLGKTPMGNFSYWKRLKDNFVQVNVSVYPRTSNDSSKNGRSAASGSEHGSSLSKPQSLSTSRRLCRCSIRLPYNCASRMMMPAAPTPCFPRRRSYPLLTAFPRSGVPFVRPCMWYENSS